MLRACGRKRGPLVEITAGVSIGIGFLAATVAHAVARAGPAWTTMLRGDVLTLLIGLVVTVGIAVSWVRFV